MNPFAALGRAGVRAIDAALLRHYRIFAFSDAPTCILRLGVTRSRHAITLSDGTRVARGEPILQLHFWNERLPMLPREGATLAWGMDFARRARRSLRDLAAFLAREVRFASIRALYAEIGFLEFGQFGKLRALARRLGFDFHAGDAPGWRFWQYAFWANLYAWWLMWTFNPASLRGKHFAGIARGELWMSRAHLMEKYGGGYDESQGARL